jgi:DNA-binding response OmpR family regulator
MAERILIVDDDPWILRMVSTLLEKRGYAIFTAADGEEALGRAEEVRPDLVVTDVMMPKMDGWELVRELRARPHLALVPVLFLTALNGEEDRLRGFRLGADDFLPKPFRFEELDLRVQNALKKKVAAQAKAAEVAHAPQASASAPARNAGIQGTLEQLGLSSLLVMVEMERKSGILRLDRPGATGRLFVREGRVIAARLDGDRVPEGARKGAACVYHLLTWADGRFDFSAVEVEMEDEVQSSTTHLLMEGARLIDEQSR